MDYVVQFITVLFASVLGPIGLNWYKNKKDQERQRKKIALKLYHQLQNYCFGLAKSIYEHDNAAALLDRDFNGDWSYAFGKLKGAHSIPNIEIEEELYLLDEDIINRLFVLVRKSYFIKFSMECLESVDIDLIIESYGESVYALINDAMYISTLISNRYKVTHTKEKWLELIPGKFKEKNDNIN